MDENGAFTVDYSFTILNAEPGDPTFRMPAGKHTFTVTPVEEVEGVGYIASGKTANVTLTAAPAPKAKVVISKTLFTDFVSMAPIGFKTMNNIAAIRTFDAEGKVTTTETSAGFTDEMRGLNSGGKINKFADSFNIDNNLNHLNGDYLTLIGELVKDVDYTEKAGISGLIQYSWTNLDGSEGSAWAQITVKPPKGREFVIAE